MNANRRVIAAILAVILTVVGLVAVVGYANGANDRALRGTSTKKVFQVTEPIAAGADETAVAKSVEQVKMPVVSIPAGAVSKLSQIKGRLTTTALLPGEQLILARFAKDGDVGKKSASNSDVPSGLQEISVVLPSARIVGDKIGAGDTAGIFASFDEFKATSVIENRVLVLGVAEPAGLGGVDGQPSHLVTLAVTASTAQKIINTIEFGHLWLTKQSDKTDVGNLKRIDGAGVLK